MLSRSLLYVPGNKPQLFDKALRSGADAIILDLEDAVPLDQKDVARTEVSRWLQAHKDERVWVRVNSGPLLRFDIEAVASMAGIYVPKVSGPDEIGDLPSPVTALIETAAGVLDARSIAAHPAVVRLAIGEADLGAELNVRLSSDEREMLPARMQIVLASAAEGLDPPVGPVSTDFKDLDLLREGTAGLRAMGFGGRSVIHPAQVPIVNEVFAPTGEELAAARRVLDLFERAGGGVCVDDGGKMIDEAVVRTARRLVTGAEAESF